MIKKSIKNSICQIQQQTINTKIFSSIKAAGLYTIQAQHSQFFKVKIIFIFSKKKNVKKKTPKT